MQSNIYHLLEQNQLIKFIWIMSPEKVEFSVFYQILNHTLQ